MDNAREFRGNLIRRVCKEYGIDPVFRPVKKPRYGAHIERLLGTVASKLKSLPGATFSNPVELGDSDPRKTAAFTFDELEAYLANYFAGDYHQSKHSELDMPPIKKWREGIHGTTQIPAHGIPPLIQDENRLRLDFLPYFERTIQAYGIQWENIHYYDDVLRPWYRVMDPEHPKELLKFRFHYDPRNISVLYFFDPKAKRYYRVPYRDPRHEPISKWERDTARRKLSADGARDVDEAMIFKTHEKLHALAENAVKETKRQRRERQARKIHGRGHAVKPEGEPDMPKDASYPDVYADVEPYEDIDA
jgi:putative transposase